MLMIRFQRTGRVNNPSYRIAVLEKERAAQAGNVVELLGTYNPHTKELGIDGEQVKAWIAKGAQPTDSLKNLLITKGILDGKKVNVLPKKTVQKTETESAGNTPAAETASHPVEAPSEAEVAAEAEPASEAPAETPTETSAA
jgi:small subunit ribosomal protein S16